MTLVTLIAYVLFLNTALRPIVTSISLLKYHQLDLLLCAVTATLLLLLNQVALYGLIIKPGFIKLIIL